MKKELTRTTKDMGVSLQYGGFAMNLVTGEYDLLSKTRLGKDQARIRAFDKASEHPELYTSEDVKVPTTIVKIREKRGSRYTAWKELPDDVAVHGEGIAEIRLFMLVCSQLAKNMSENAEVEIAINKKDVLQVALDCNNLEDNNFETIASLCRKAGMMSLEIDRWNEDSYDTIQVFSRIDGYGINSENKDKVLFVVNEDAADYLRNLKVA